MWWSRDVVRSPSEAVCWSCLTREEGRYGGLSRAVLEGSILEGSMLEGSMLEGSMLEGSMLEGSMLAGTTRTGGAGDTVCKDLIG